uniref:Transcriptional adapter 3-like n=1 Tax=Hirondellea gigas TaxID=1518452 RepID=A0A2P2I1R2_9CRUS
MAPSPSKGKGFHKSSGKFFRKKDQDSGRYSSTSNNHTSNGTGSSKKDESSSCNGSSSSVDLKDCALTLPVMSAIDHINYLPRYNNLCNGDTISMEELDNLQLELELLASSMLVRQSSLTGQMGILEQIEKGKVVPRPVTAGKRMRSDTDQLQRPSKKTKEGSGKPRDVLHPPPSTPNQTPPPPPSNHSKVKCSIVRNEPLFDVPDLPSAEPPRPPPPRNDITNRFWAMVDSYCQEMTADDIKMLEELIASHNDDPDVYKVQPLGKHYTLRWAQEDLMDEQKEGNKLSDGGNSGSNNHGKKKGSSSNEVPEKLLKEVDLNHHTSGDDTAPLGPLAQRLLASLVEDKLLLQNHSPSAADSNGENKGVAVGRPSFLRSLAMGSGAGLDKRLRKELQDHGIIEPDHPGTEDDGEILQELKRCQGELKGVSAHNHTQLNRLLKLARDALYRHDLKKKLKDSEAKVIESYKNISSLRVKKKPLVKKDKETAWKAIKDRELIVKQLDRFTV